MLQFVIRRVDAGVRGGQKQIDAVEMDAVYLGLGRQVEHGFQWNERLRTGALAYEAGPHGVVDCRMPVLLGCHIIFLTAVAHPDYQDRNA